LAGTRFPRVPLPELSEAIGSEVGTIRAAVKLFLVQRGLYSRESTFQRRKLLSIFPRREVSIRLASALGR